jgi:histidinol phosphatase-like enzyme
LCDCRKPHPKFLQQAAEEFLLDLPHCYMVGDRASDIQTGINAGTKTVLVLTGAGRDVMNSRSVAPDFVASDIAGAADWIVADSAAHRQPRS